MRKRERQVVLQAPTSISDIAKHDTVRVIALTGSAADHLVISTSERPPRVGDVGIVVDIADRLGGVGRHYTVELSHADARPVWLAVFARHELELVT
jgi:hypothetical protein